MSENDEEEIYDWVATEGEAMFNSFDERNYKIPNRNYSVNFGLKKFLFPTEGKFNTRTLYINSYIGYNNTAIEYTITDYIDIGFQHIDEPENPQEGDVFGEIYDDEINKTISSIYNSKNSTDSYSISIGLGHRYDVKHKLFNIPKLTFGIDIQYLTLTLLNDYYTSFKSTDYNEEFYGSNYYRGDNTSDSSDNDSSIMIGGPGINIFMKYFF
jgi:hypothetical protein